MRMTSQSWIGFLVLLSCFILEACSRPSNNEAVYPVYEPTEEVTEQTDVNERDERTLEDQIRIAYAQPQGETTRDILQKIKTVNEGLKKPQRQQINYNTQPYSGGYILDRTILEKIQQIIAAGKLQGLAGQQKVSNNEDNNSLTNDDVTRTESARALPYVQAAAIANNALQGNQAAGYVPLPYITSMPVVVMPSANGAFAAPLANGIGSLNMGSEQVTRQGPSFPFQVPSLPLQVPWPLAPFFPILLKDPLLHYLGGGSWQNLIEYGQSADVCNRKQKSSEAENTDVKVSKTDENFDDDNENNISLGPINVGSSRQGRKIKKRTIAKSTPIQKLDTIKDVQKLFGQKPFSTKKPVKKEDPPTNTDTKTYEDEDEKAELRFPFMSDFNPFGSKKPIVPSPGFFINRLKVRRGGVAIAGPGGVATAGRGGTAVVGPGGLAYTQPGGLAVAGPAARVVALDSEADMNSVVSRLQQQSETDGSVPRLLQAIPEGKVVATGPVIYYHPVSSQYNQGPWRWKTAGYGKAQKEENIFTSGADEYYYDGIDFYKTRASFQDSTFRILVNPIARAVNKKGVAIANPVSSVVLARGMKGTIVHKPTASAVVGPGGIAHAQSDLYIYEYVTDYAPLKYVPFYGGAKGQYLEIKTDHRGNVISEKIVSEENITSENIVKVSEENLLARVLGANLQNLKILSTSVLKLHNLGRKTGGLSVSDKDRFKSELSALGEAASNTIKLIEEVGEDLDVLFRSNASRRQYYDQFEDVGEEGVGVDASENGEQPGIPIEVLEGATIADAKPVGLAVIGENGLAAARPIGTAVASSGIAIARPVGTAIAGVNPAALGINFQLHKP